MASIELSEQQVCDLQWLAWRVLRNPKLSEEVFSEVKTRFPGQIEDFVSMVLSAGLQNYEDERNGRWTTDMLSVAGGRLLLDEEMTAFRTDLLYGWFVRGDINLVHGFSGSGKSRLLIEMEDARRNGREFLGNKRPLNGLPLFICFDRDARDFKDMLVSMNLPEDFANAADPQARGEGKNKMTAIQGVLDIAKDFAYPELVVIEGLDILVGNGNNGEAVAEVLRGLQQIGRKTGCCIVGTVGSPKRQSTKDRYANTRHAVIGNQAWVRMSRTVIGMEMEMAGTASDRKETGFRVVNLDTRHSRPRKFKVGFSEDGRMYEAGVKVEINEAEDMSYKQAVEQAEQRLRDLQGISQATYYRRKECKK
jgi:AAA domain